LYIYSYLGPLLENPVRYYLFDDFIVIGQESQSLFGMDYYNWCKLVTPLVMNVFGKINGPSVIKYQLEKISLEW